MYLWIFISIATSILHTTLGFFIENEIFRFISYAMSLLVFAICMIATFIKETDLNKRIEKLEKYKGE